MFTGTFKQAGEWAILLSEQGFDGSEIVENAMMVGDDWTTPLSATAVFDAWADYEGLINCGPILRNAYEAIMGAE